MGNSYRLACLPNEAGRNVFDGAEVLGRVQRQSGLRRAAVVVLRTPIGGANGANGEERPDGPGWRVWNAKGIRREVIEVRLRASADGTGEDDEELEEDCRSQEEPRDQRDDWDWAGRG